MIRASWRALGNWTCTALAPISLGNCWPSQYSSSTPLLLLVQHYTSFMCFTLSHPSSSYLTLGGTPLKLVYFFGYPFSTRADSFEQLMAYFGISISQLNVPVPQEVQGSYSRELSSTSLLKFFCSVWHSPRVAWPAHILSHPHGIKYRLLWAYRVLFYSGTHLGIGVYWNSSWTVGWSLS